VVAARRAGGEGGNPAAFRRRAPGTRVRCSPALRPITAAAAMAPWSPP